MKYICITTAFIIFTILNCTDGNMALEKSTTQSIIISGYVTDSSSDQISDVTIEAVEINDDSHEERNEVQTDLNGFYKYIYISGITIRNGETSELIKYTDQIKIKYSKDNYQSEIKEFRIDKNKLLEYYDSNTNEQEKMKNPGEISCNIILMDE